MLTVIIVIHLMLVLGLIGVVLLQKSEGGGLVSSTSGFMTGRGTANVLTRTTALLAVGFFITSLAVVMAGRSRPTPGLDHQYRGWFADAGSAGWFSGADRVGRPRHTGPIEVEREPQRPLQPRRVGRKSHNRNR